MKKLNKNEKGFSVVELFLVIIVIFLLGMVGWYVFNKHSKGENSNTAKKSSTLAYNHFKDTPECATYNNYSVNNVNLPNNFTIQMRNYIQCGTFYTDNASDQQQDILIGLKGKTNFSSLATEIADINNWFTIHGWKPSTPPNHMGNFTKGLNDITITPISYNPSYVIINIYSNVDYSKYPSTNKPSPPQILPALQQQVKDAPYTYYAPTNIPFLQTTPKPNSNNLSASTLDFLGIEYNYYPNSNNAVGVTINYGNTQTTTALDNCNANNDNSCSLFATTPMGYKLYGDYDASTPTDPVLGDVYVDIKNTDLDIKVDSPINSAMSVNDYITLVDSMQAINN